MLHRFDEILLGIARLVSAVIQLVSQRVDFALCQFQSTRLQGHKHDKYERSITNIKNQRNIKNVPSRRSSRRKCRYLRRQGAGSRCSLPRHSFSCRSASSFLTLQGFCTVLNRFQTFIRKNVRKINSLDLVSECAHMWMYGSNMALGESRETAASRLLGVAVGPRLLTVGVTLVDDHSGGTECAVGNCLCASPRS